MAKYQGDPTAFWFDRAVLNFGAMVESDIEHATRNAKDDKTARSLAHQRLMKWLDFDGKLTNQRFAAPPITKTRVGGDSDRQL